MNDSQRSVLLAAVTENPSESADPSALRMLRMRARRRLHQLMDQASVLGVTVGFQLRRVMREAEVFISKALPLDAERVPAAVLSVAAALSIGLAALPGEVADGPWDGGGPDAVFDAGATGGVVGSERPALTDRSLATRGEGGSANARRARSKDGSESDDDTIGNETDIYGRIAEGTYVAGSAEIQLEGFDEQGRDVLTTGTGSLSCSTSPSGGAGASCTHGGDGWEQRSVRVKQHAEVWVQGHRVL